MSPGRIIFLNRFYWPDEPATAQLLADLAPALAARGHAVTVIASRPAGAPARELHEGVTVERLPGTRWGRRRLAGRAVDFATYHGAAGWKMLRLLRRTDTVVAMTDPPLIGVLTWLVAKARGARLVHWVQDIYPEIAAEVTGRRILLALRPCRNAAWRSAAACVLPGDDMADAVRAAGVAPERIHVAPNWAPSGLAPADAGAIAARRRAWGLEGRFIAAYSGNLGRVHDLTPLLEVAALLRDEPSFVLLFIGSGARRPALEAAARAEGLPNVRFLPAQPRRDLAASLGAADVHFVTLRAGAARWVFPSKLYGAAAVARPVIFIGDKDSGLARKIIAHGFGAAFARDETAAIAALLRRLHGDEAGRLALGAAAQRFAAGGDRNAIEWWDRLLRGALAGATLVR